MLKNIDWDDIRANIAIGIGIAAFSGISYFFRELHRIIDPMIRER